MQNEMQNDYEIQDVPVMTTFRGKQARGSAVLGETSRVDGLTQHPRPPQQDQHCTKRENHIKKNQTPAKQASSLVEGLLGIQLGLELGDDRIPVGNLLL